MSARSGETESFSVRQKHPLYEFLRLVCSPPDRKHGLSHGVCDGDVTIIRFAVFGDQADLAAKNIKRSPGTCSR